MCICASGREITLATQQRYIEHIYRARQFFAEKQYIKACEEFETAFTFRNDFVPDLYNCAESYDKLNNTRKTLLYLKLSIANGCDWYEDEDKLLNLKKTKDYQPISQYVAYKMLFYKNVNMEYLRQLDSLVVHDQYVRNNSSAREDYMSVNDSLDMIGLKKLVDKYGYPTYEAVGYRGATDAFILLLHGWSMHDDHDHNYWQYYQPLILKEVKNFHLMPEYYAVLYDRAASGGKGGKVCYGSQFEMNSDGSFGLTAINDVANVDERRKAIGLPPLEDDLKISGIALPEGYVRK